jgi:hypothetical protein
VPSGFVPPVPPEPFVEDSFTDVAGTILQSHVGEVGATWTRHTNSSASSAAITSAGRLRPTANAVTLIYFTSGTPATAEYDVQSVFRPVTQVSGDLVGICGRMDTAANTMYGVRYVVATGKWQLYKVVAGALTDLDAANGTMALNNLQEYVVKLEVRDATKKAYVDGVEVLTSTDNAITAAGRPGIRWTTAASSDSTGIHLDDFQAVDPS